MLGTKIKGGTIVAPFVFLVAILVLLLPVIKHLCVIEFHIVLMHEVSRFTFLHSYVPPNNLLYNNQIYVQDHGCRSDQ